MYRRRIFPVLLGIRHVTLDGTMQYGDSFSDLASALEGLQVACILLMCSQPEEISASLPSLRAAFDGPIGAYSQVGYRPIAPLQEGSNTDAFESNTNTPERLAKFASEWLSMGAQIVGGCCATTPDHIAAMRRAVLA